MATEGNWTIVTDVISGNISIDNKTNIPQGDVSDIAAGYFESWAVQKGSEYLYILKEQLLSLGWTVVSSSHRINYVNGSRDLITNFNNGPFFSAEAGDTWIPTNGIGTPTGDYSSFVDGGILEGNPPWSVIYPGYVANTTPTTSSYLRNINATQFKTNNNPLTYAEFGRSWCLLKAPNTGSTNYGAFYEGNPSSNYHILLDYAEDTDTDIYFYNKSVPSTTFKQFTIADYSSSFGSKVTIYVFPNYGDIYSNLNDQSDLNSGKYTPDHLKRPSHLFEVGTIINTGTEAPAGQAKFKFVNNTTNNQLISNIIHDKTHGSTIIIASENSQVNSTIILGTIADGISSAITQENDGFTPGTKFFSFWSGLQRGTTQLPAWYAGQVVPIGDTTSTGADPRVYLSKFKLSNTMFDFTEKNAHTFYYKRYDPGRPGIQYEDARLVTCVPVFMTEGIKFKKKKKGAPTVTLPPNVVMWNKTDSFAKPTTDFTYVEWPLPLLAVVPGNSNYSYVGRMMDIKLGPLNAVNGIIAQDPGSQNGQFDRIFLNGLWFPFGGDESLIY